MNVLEKIFEDIEKAIEAYSKNRDMRFVVGADKMANKAKEIIISHMNEVEDMHGKRLIDASDDWIPVEERLPNKREFQEAYCRNHYAAEFLVTIEGATRPTTLYFKNNSWFDEERNYCKVIAWQPLPEAYHPKETPAAEHIMSRFTRVE